MASVWIGCKLPNGLMMEIVQPGNGLMPAPQGKRVMLKGANSMRATVKDNPIIGKYAVTEVDESFWDEWLKRHKDFLFIKNGAIFVEKSMKDAQAHAKADMKAKTGLEPLNPEKDERVKGVTPDKEKLAHALRGSRAIAEVE